MKPSFSPTPEMINAAELCVMAMAHTQTIRPIVEEHKKKVLAENSYPFADRFKEMARKRGHELAEFCKEDNAIYMMSDEDFQDYHAKCLALHLSKGIKVEHPDHCPLLVAEELQRKAERHLCEVMEPITKLSVDDVLCSADGIKNYNQLIDLTLRLLVPYLNSSNQVLKRFSNKG